jgi:hypothetical protein
MHKQGARGVMTWHRMVVIQRTELNDGTAGVRNVTAAAHRHRHHQHTPPLLLLPPLVARAGGQP